MRMVMIQYWYCFPRVRAWGWYSLGKVMGMIKYSMIIVTVQYGHSHGIAWT